MTQQTRTINHMMSFLEFIRVFEETVLYIFPLKHEGKHNHLNDEYGKESVEGCFRKRDQDGNQNKASILNSCKTIKMNVNQPLGYTHRSQ